MNKEIFIKYLNNSCSDTELSELLTCLYSGSADENLKSFTNSDTIKNESLNQILNLMKRCTPIEDKILQSEKSDEGTFSKQQIVIQQNMKNQDKL